MGEGGRLDGVCGEEEHAKGEEEGHPPSEVLGEWLVCELLVSMKTRVRSKGECLGSQKYSWAMVRVFHTSGEHDQANSTVTTPWRESTTRSGKRSHLQKTVDHPPSLTDCPKPPGSSSPA